MSTFRADQGLLRTFPLAKIHRAVATFLVVAIAPVSAWPDTPAGKVTFLLGKVVATPAGSSVARVLQEGDAVYPGDRLSTREGAHVHVRFVDDGLLSVRPNSDLIIEEYQYVSDQPQESRIKFELLDGNARSISGQGAKAARDKFRLNTPIAAIGVRGTDFVVSAKESLIRAIVNEGAIVVAPFSESCQETGVGPCSESGVELAGGSRHFLEYSSVLDSPRLVPFDQSNAPDLIIEEVLDDGSGVEGESEIDTEAGTDAGSAEGDAENGAEGLDSVIDEAESLAAEPDWLLDRRRSSQLGDAVSAVEDQETGDWTPREPLSEGVLQSRQLAWGRWNDLIESSDRIVLTRLQAAEGRKVAVGNNEYVLYRTPGPDGSNSLLPGLGQVSFNLVDAQAQLQTSSGTYLMEVRNGWLNIDFNQQKFATGVLLNHAITSEVSISGQGQISDKGYFYTRDGIDFLSGAVSLDGKEASYLFEHSIDAGDIEGITHWNGN